MQTHTSPRETGTDLVRKSTTHPHSLVTVSAMGCPPGVSDGVEVRDPYEDESRDQLTLRISTEDRYYIHSTGSKYQRYVRDSERVG